MKTKMGISVSAMCALAYFLGAIGHELVLFIFAAYILFIESEKELRECVIKSIVLVVIFSIAIFLVDIIPDILLKITQFSSLSYMKYIDDITNVFRMISTIIYYFEKILLVYLGVQALNKKYVQLDRIDSLIEKYINN